MKRGTKLRLVWAAVAGVVLIATVAGAAIFLLQRTATQVRNLERMRGYVAAVNGFKQVHEVYPPTLREALISSSLSARAQGELLNLRDLWGHPVMYESDGKTFLLVSFGHDGKPDGTDYLSAKRSSGQLSCSDFDADQFFTEVGEHRTCGK